MGDDLVKCCNCGRWIGFEDMQDGSARFEFTPDSEYSSEDSAWTCRICVMKEKQRKEGRRHGR